MEKSKKKVEDFVIIFRKRQDRRGVIIFKPIGVRLGYLDSESNQFVTKDGDRYHYLYENEYLNSFGLRTNVRDFMKKYQLNLAAAKETIRLYFKELKEYSYYLQMSDSKDPKTLSFMGKKGNTVYQVMEPDIEIARKSFKNKGKLNFDTGKLREEIKKQVIGQDDAIDDIVTTIWQNFRGNHKSNLLLIGPSGVGKTEIIRSISKKLDVPMITVNATDITQTGYLGACIEDSIAGLVRASNYDLEKASRGIIFIDEIDKKAGFGEYNTGVGTTGVQDELLKLLEDGDYEVNISNNPFVPKMVTMNTKNITFICAGAFSLMKEKKEQKNKALIGFGQKRVSSNEKNSEKITSNDLVTYGLKSELVGRLSNIIQLNSLNKDHFIEIMKNPNNQTIQEKIEILNDLGIEFQLEEEVYDLLADRAIQNNTGARGLISAVDQLFIKAMKEISQSPNEYEKLIINKDTVRDPHIYTLVKKKKGSN